MRFVNDYNRILRKKEICCQLAQQYTIRHELDGGIGGDCGIISDLVRYFRRC